MKITRVLSILMEFSVAVTGAYFSFGLDDQHEKTIAMVTLCYGAIIVALELHFYNEDKLFEKMPVLKSLGDVKIGQHQIDVMSSFNEINEIPLREVADAAWREFSSETKSLFGAKRSENLTPAEYINFIERQLERIEESANVFALSLYAEDEFLSNNHEINFHEAQLSAITRKNVNISRIFACDEQRMAQLKETPFFEDHLGVINGLFVNIEEVKKRGPAIRNGFILIGSVLFEDRPQHIGLSGVMSMNNDDIERAEKEFNLLSKHARPLSEFFR